MIFKNKIVREIFWTEKDNSRNEKNLNPKQTFEFLAVKEKAHNHPKNCTNYKNMT